MSSMGMTAPTPARRAELRALAETLCAEPVNRRHPRMEVEAIDALPALLDALDAAEARAQAAEGVLRGYEAWEARIILDSDAWDHGGRADLPTLTHALWDEMLDLQAKRNAALAPKPAAEPQGNWLAQQVRASVASIEALPPGLRPEAERFRAELLDRPPKPAAGPAPTLREEIDRFRRDVLGLTPEPTTEERPADAE